MKCITFANRNFKEIVRYPLTILFGMSFPIVLMGLFSIIQNNIPLPLFELDKLTPDITVFVISFISLFSGLLLARDKTTAFLTRPYSSPHEGLGIYNGV